MRSNSNARNAIPSQSRLLEEKIPYNQCRGKSLRDSEKLREVLLWRSLELARGFVRARAQSIYFTILYYTIPYYTRLYYTILYYTVL